MLKLYILHCSTDALFQQTLYCGLQKLKEKQTNIVNFSTQLPANCNPLCCGAQKPQWTPGPITG